MRYKLSGSFPEKDLWALKDITFKVKKSGLTEIRITHNRKQKYLSTGIMLLPKQWKRGLVTNCADALQLNQIINKMLVDIRKVILQMTEENNIDILIKSESSK